MTPLLLRRWRLATVPRLGALFLHATSPVVVLISLLFTGRSETLLFWIGLWFAAVVHASGHVLASIRCGGPPATITLYPFFSVCRLDQAPAKPTTDLIVTAAGPLASAIVGAGLLSLVHEFSDGSPEWLAQWARIQIGYGLVSLLPMYPLDGARLLRLGLQWRMPRARAWETAGFVGQATAAGVVLWGLVRGMFLVAVAGVAFYVVGRFALFLQTAIQRINTIEREEHEEADDDGMTITMTQTADGVWRADDSTAGSSEPRSFF